MVSFRCLCRFAIAFHAGFTERDWFTLYKQLNQFEAKRRKSLFVNLACECDSILTNVKQRTAVTSGESLAHEAIRDVQQQPVAVLLQRSPDSSTGMGRIGTILVGLLLRFGFGEIHGGK